MDGWTLAEAIILRAGAVALALSAIVSALAVGARYFVVRPLKAFIADVTEAQSERMSDRVERLESEFRPNGGGSMRDAVTRLETKVDLLAHDLQAHKRERHAA